MSDELKLKHTAGTITTAEIRSKAKYEEKETTNVSPYPGSNEMVSLVAWGGYWREKAFKAECENKILVVFEIPREYEGELTVSIDNLLQDRIERLKK